MAKPATDRSLTVLEDLRVEDIPEEGLAFDEAIPRSWLETRIAEGHGLTFAATEDGHAKLDVTALGDTDERPPVRIQGRLSASISTDCVRCLETVESELDVEVDLMLLPDDPEGTDQQPTLDTGDEALDEARYSGRVIPLPEMIRELLVLELDMNPTCLDEPGCDRRTKVLIEEANRPGEQAMDAPAGPDPRWAGLARFRNDGD